MHFNNVVLTVPFFMQKKSADRMMILNLGPVCKRMTLGWRWGWGVGGCSDTSEVKGRKREDEVERDGQH